MARMALLSIFYDYAAARTSEQQRELIIVPKSPNRQSRRFLNDINSTHASSVYTLDARRTEALRSVCPVTMGTPRLLQQLKQGASQDIDLRYGHGRRLVVDGHAALHRAAYRQGVAANLVLSGCVKALGQAVAADVQTFEKYGWRVTVVFDGLPPPAKKRTTVSRRDEREAALIDAEQTPIGTERERLLMKAVDFTPRVVARTSALLRSLIHGECVTSPYEADAQLVSMQNYYRSRFPGEEVFIWANDSDVFVLGAINLLWEVRGLRGRDSDDFIGSCIRRDLVLNPSPEVLLDVSQGEFLRRLHHIPADPTECESCPTSLLQPARVGERLVDIACLAGNDHYKFDGIGWATASAIALRVSPSYDTEARSPPADVVRALADAVTSSPRFLGGLSVHEVEERIWAARRMFVHPVVFNVGKSRQEHLSGMEGTSDITSVTGVVESDQTISAKLFAQQLSPETKREWIPSILERGGLVREVHAELSRTGAGTGNGRLAGNALLGAKRRRRGVDVDSREHQEKDGAGSRNALHSRQQEAGRLGDRLSLPPTGSDFSTWLVKPLRDFLQGVRCLERSGWSTYKKAELVELAGDVMRMVEGLDPSAPRHHLLLRPPPESATFEEKLKDMMPGIPNLAHFTTDMDELLMNLPEVAESVIADWLTEGRDVHNRSTRVMYRSMQRAMDLGAAGGLSGSLVMNPDGSGSGVIWLHLRVPASMKAHDYNAYVKIAVLRVQEDTIYCDHPQDDESDMDEYANDGDDPRRNDGGDTWKLLATRVLAALCDCTGGRAGQCHHVGMVLQLVRLLKMSPAQVEDFNPVSSTGRPCQWILDHCRGGREAYHNTWWPLTLPAMAAEVRQLRDPRGQESFGWDISHAGGGVVDGNRQDYVPYRAGGEWAERHENHVKGESISLVQQSRFSNLNNVLRAAKSQDGARRVRLTSDFLPPRVRRNGP